MNQPIWSTTNFEIGKKEVKENWEIRFDAEFDYMWIEPSADNPKNKEHYFKIYNTELKSFIRQLLQVQKSEILRGMPKEKDLGWETITEKDREIKTQERIYNALLAEVKTIIEKI